MLAQRLWRWANIKPSLVLAGIREYAEAHDV